MTIEVAASLTASKTGRREQLAELLVRHAAEFGTFVYPLSQNQASLWFQWEYAPDSAAYSVGFAARIRSPLDVVALRRALQALLDRHGALRTCFPFRGRPPLQVVVGQVDVELVEVDAFSLSDRDLESRVGRDYSAPVDLTRVPALRAVLYRRADDDHVLLLVAHHTLVDLWGLSVLLEELGALYQAATNGAAAALPPPEADYAGFVRWQSQLLASAEGERLGRYWEAQLADAATVLNLPTDRPRPALQTLVGRSFPFALDADLSAGISRLAQQERTSTYTILLAAFQVLLSRYTEQLDVLVGSPVAGRSRPEFDGVVGHFVNMIVLRGRLGGDPPFRTLIRQTRETVLAALEHQDYPFPALVDRLQAPRDPSRSPLFQVCFAFQRAPRLEELTGFLLSAPDTPPLNLGDLVLEPFPLSQQQGQFDLSLWMAEARGRLHGELKYNSDLFDGTTIERLASHLAATLRGVVADPDQRLSQIPLLPAAERQLVLDTWNRTAAPYRHEACLHHLVTEQAERTPDAVAVVCGVQQLTYRQLDERANQLARQLQLLGVGRGGLVACYLDRSLDVVPALLGILKAGAGYVPLEPQYPAARVELILSSLPVRCVVTQTAHIDTLQRFEAPLVEHLLCVDDGDAEPLVAAPTGPRTVCTAADIRRQPTGAVKSPSLADDTAYIIFTSGSTGVPKGVEVAHRPVINLIEWVNTTFGVGPDDRVLFVTSPCFDLSVYDVFGVLAAGGSIEVATRDDLLDPNRLVRLLVERPVTFWDSAPPALAQLVPFLPDSAPASPLRLVFLSGDWIPLPLPDRIRSVFPNAQLVSLGGATEAAIWSNWFPIADIDPHWVSIPYGRPIQNARYYILDGAMQPCPIGVPGDLYIGGECLADGYAYDPDLTASKFLPDPFAGTAGARMYRTGDRARWFPDGNIEFLGRKDFQVKIRGYRIELGEIEAALLQDESVGECMVMARDDVGSEKVLVAYVVPADRATPSLQALRAGLKDKLPDYMVPPHVVFLDHLPMTSNGKVDRKALPAPERHRDDLGVAFVEARTPLEATVAEIFARALGVDRVGADDDFFELGGHSLLAVQVVHDLEEATGARLAVSALLQAPTVAELAARLGTVPAAPSLLVQIRPSGAAVGGGAARTLYCFHPSGGEAIVYRALTDHLPTDLGITGVQSAGLAGGEECSSLEEMAASYADAIAMERSGPYLLAGWSLGGVLAHAVATRLEDAGARVDLVALWDAGLPAESPVLEKDPYFVLSAALGSLGAVFAALDRTERDRAMAELLRHPEADRLPTALRWAQERGLVPTGSSVAAIEREAALSRLHGELLLGHRAGVVQAPLHVWWAQDSLVDGRPPTDWRAHTAGTVTETIVRANHFTILEPPALAELAAGLVAALANSGTAVRERS